MDHPNPDSPFTVGQKVAITSTVLTDNVVTGKVIGWDPQTGQTVVQNDDGGMFMRYDAEIQPHDMEAKDYVGKMVEFSTTEGLMVLPVIASDGDLMIMMAPDETLAFILDTDGNVADSTPLLAVFCDDITCSISEYPA